MTSCTLVDTIVHVDVLGSRDITRDILCLGLTGCLTGVYFTPLPCQACLPVPRHLADTVFVGSLVKRVVLKSWRGYTLIVP